MAKGPTITTIASGYYSRTALNDNFTNIDTAFDNTLSLDGSTPNSLGADLDLNNNDILNAKDINADRVLLGGSLLSPSSVVVDAENVNFTPTGAIASTDVQAALVEVSTLHYDTVADLLASTKPSRGVGSIWEAQGFRYTEVASGGDVVTAGGIQLDVLAGSAGFEARAFGSTLDEVTAQAAMDAVVASTTEDRLVFSGVWSFAAGVVLSDPQDIRVDASGASFYTSAEILMFDLNGRADPTYEDNESRQNFHWVGGQFFCTITTPTKATAVRLYGMRDASFKPDKMEGFYTNVDAAGKDTIVLSGWKSFNVRHNIRFAPWSIIGGPLLIEMSNLHMSHASYNTPAILSYMPLTDSVLRDFSCNLGSGAAHTGVIELHRDVLLGLTSKVGTFTVGETITGTTSGATMVFDELYTHPFAFQIAQTLDYLVGTDKSAANFIGGEAVTGGTSGASGVIASGSVTYPDAYITQGPTWQNFHIEGANHFEAGSGATGAVCVRLLDRIKRGITSSHFLLDLGSVGVNGGGAIGVELQNVSAVEVKGRFSQTTGNGTPIKCDSRCLDIKVSKPSYFSTGAIDLNSMPRTELDLSDFNKTFITDDVVTGWTPKTLSGVVSATILDMSSDFSSFVTVGGLSPIGYDFNIVAADTGSAAAAAARPRIRLHHPDDVTTNRYCVLGFRGAPDSEERGAQFFVGADTNGDIEYDAIASGTSTMTASLRVTRMLF